MLYLYIEDIVANSIIELNKIDGSRCVLIDDAKKYGVEVANCLNKRGYFTKLKLSPEAIDSFEVKYSDFFKKYYDNGTYGFLLKSGKSIDEINNAFREIINIEIVDSFSDDEVIEKSFPNRIKKRVKKKQ